MATITIDYTDLCAKGLNSIATTYGTNIRQKVDCSKTPLTGSKSYSLVKLPKGFVVRHALVNVTTATATSGLTLSFGSNQKDGSGDQIVYSATLAATAVAMTLLDIDKPKFVTDANVTTKTVADDDTYLVVIPSATCNDAVFEISVAGDFMLDPIDSNT